MTEEKHCNHQFVVLRRGLPNTSIRLAEKKPVTVAFLGGSITEGAGASEADTFSWRALTGKYLQERFVNHEFRFINAGVGGTNSTLGPIDYRLMSCNTVRLICCLLNLASMTTVTGKNRLEAWKELCASADGCRPPLTFASCIRQQKRICQGATPITLLSTKK